ncbi:MAG TPA: hypothetical protein VMS37_19560 [Verrucomicrobiae bacterium]|nr:hypothetical protein [Verrucomicrobiae bacterium]
MNLRCARCGVVLLVCGHALAQTANPGTADDSGSGGLSRAVNYVFDYLSMAGRHTAADFKPLTQHERNAIYARSLINPVWYLKGATSAAIDLVHDKPEEWEQGASGYGKRFGNIMGQYAIQRTTTFGLASLLHEDNRYFNSGKKGFGRRVVYAMASSILARHDDGRRYPSVSGITGFAAGAFLSRLWQPPSTSTAGDGAVSFGITMGYNVLTTTVKEFLPDLTRPLTKNRGNKKSPDKSGAGVTAH